MAARRISVIVPTYERSGLLRRALASIRALEGPDIELEIVLADNSGACPQTRAIAAEFRCVYLLVERKGISEARNAALKAATGEFIAFLDDDDAWLEGHLRPHLKLFDERPELELVIGQVVPIDHTYTIRGEPWLPNFPKPGADLLRRMLGGFFPQVGSILVRAGMRDEIGVFDTKLKGGEDLDWLLRIAVRNRVGFVKQPCMLFTYRPGGTFDALQIERFKFDRLVFNRYAWRWWRLWQSPMQMSRAYSGTVMYYYQYFVDAALERATRGKRIAALRAIWIAMSIFPLRGAKHLLWNTPLQQALFRSLSTGQVAAHLRNLPLWLFVTTWSGSS